MSSVAIFLKTEGHERLSYVQVNAICVGLVVSCKRIYELRDINFYSKEKKSDFSDSFTEVLTH